MSGTTFKRKFRWTLKGELPGGIFKEMFVKIAARPNLHIEEIKLPNGSILPGKSEWEQITATEEIKLPNGSILPGKSEWEQITATAYDVQGELDWNVITPSVISDTTEKPAAERLGKFIISLYDGCGVLMEEWTLNEAYFSKISFADVYPEQNDIEFIIKYSSVDYNNKIDAFKTNPLHTPSYGAMGLGLLASTIKCPHCNQEFKHVNNSIIY